MDRGFKQGYPYGELPEEINDCGCMLPVLAKYAWYARESVKGKVEDRMVDDLFQAAMRIALSIDNRIFDNLGKPNLTNEFFEAYKNKNRIDKIVAVETLVHLQHDNGSVMQFACDYGGVPKGSRPPDNILYQEAISAVLLDLLAEK